MARARFPAWLIVAFLFCATAPPNLYAQRRKGSGIGAKVPAQSEALRNPIPPPVRRPPPPPRPETIALPYNMTWGDTQNRLASLFAGVSAQIVNKKVDGKTEIWTVKGLIAPNLQASLFTFQEGQLAALEFDYSQPEWDTAKYNDQMGRFRQLLETQCGGPGEIVSRTGEQPTEAGIKQSLMGYQWKHGDTVAQLFYFSAEGTDPSQTFRSISVHYHYQNPYPDEPVDGGMPLEPNPGADPNSNPLFGGVAKPPEPDPSPSPSPSPSASPSPSPEASPAASPSPSPTPEPTPEAKGKGKKGKKSKATPKPTPPVNDPLPQ